MLVGYARVSTKSQSLQPQIDALENEGVERIFTDVASGADPEREGLAEAFEFMRSGDTFVVFRLDRFGRSLKDLLKRIEQLEERGVEFRSIADGLRTDSASGKLVFHVVGAIAQFERNLIKQRTREGLDAARAEGRVGGRKKAIQYSDMPILSRLIRADDVTTEQIAERFDVTRKTIYAYVAPDGTWRDEEYIRRREREQ
ncbi:hypothetical protein [Salisaeta icosahedral phage 1]|uniref:DNA invertase n=1 Tax=Salisaeta icosahedral phage 1 TaxID=1183239 RepID=UPI00025EA910|nr:DNA invertase [Salisaeta icosahedral phage 1]AFJ21458.1 hypothetical protein [Salisaeta icosahedral phage 1]